MQKNLIILKTVFFLMFSLFVGTESVLAGNVLIKKFVDGELAEGESSFEITSHTASVGNLEWERVFGVCKFDCIFSGFDGKITDLKINGRMFVMGNLKVTNSTIILDRLGKVTVYTGPGIFILALTPEQTKFLDAP